MAAFATLALTIGSAPLAHAQPSDGAPATTTVALADVGDQSTVSFYGDTSSTTLTFPVPRGLRPSALNTVVNLPFSIVSGTLTASQDDRVISKVGVPLEDLAPVVVPLDGVAVIDDAVTLTLKLTALAPEGYCLDQENPIGLVNSSLVYEGAEVAPTVVADFLPPVLRLLTIGIPSAPTQSESDAAIQVAADLQAKYRTQSPRVVFVPLADGANTIDGPEQPFERRIIIKEGGREGLSLSPGDTRQLLVSGTPTALGAQARLLTDPSLPLAEAGTVVAGDLRPNTPTVGDSITLAQLGSPELSNIGVAPQVGIALDQTRFGRPTQGYRIHVLGSHTPVPGDIGARMTASVEGEVIDSWQAGGDGAIDHWVDVPDRLVARYTNVMIGVDTSGNTGRCREFRAIDLTVDGRTVVQSTPAQPPIPSGFGSLPQALMPELKVGIDPGKFADTDRAARIVLGLQRLSAVPLRTEVMSVQQAIDSKQSAILVAPDGWTDSSIALPLSSQDRQLTLASVGGDDQQVTLTLDPGAQFGSLQTILDGQRTLLVATSNGAAARLDDLLRWLEDNPRGWAALRGNVVVSFEGREPLLVPDRASLSVFGPASAQSQSDTAAQTQSPPIWWLAGGAAAVLVIAIAAYRIGARRRS